MFQIFEHALSIRTKEHDSSVRGAGVLTSKSCSFDRIPTNTWANSFCSNTKNMLELAYKFQPHPPTRIYHVSDIYSITKYKRKNAWLGVWGAGGARGLGGSVALGGLGWPEGSGGLLGLGSLGAPGGLGGQVRAGGTTLMRIVVAKFCLTW